MARVPARVGAWLPLISILLLRHRVPYTQILGETKRALAWVKDSGTSIIDRKDRLRATPRAGASPRSSRPRPVPTISASRATRVWPRACGTGVYDLAMEDYQDAAAWSWSCCTSFSTAMAASARRARPGCRRPGRRCPSYVDPNDTPCCWPTDGGLRVPWEQAQHERRA